MINKTFPLVSLLIPNYNQAKYISKALESALAQDYPNLEIIVSDDCSTDNTSEVVKRYLKDKRLKYYRNKVNLGRVKNYRLSLEKYAKGEWVVNLDGDDFYLDKHFITEIIDTIQRAKTKDVVFAQGGKVKEVKGRIIKDIPNIKEHIELMSGEAFFFRFPTDTHFSHMSTIYKRNLAIKIGFYRYDISSSDVESFLRLALHGDVILIKKAYGQWVRHDSNFSENLDIGIKKENLMYIASVCDYASKMGVEQKKLNEWRKELIKINLKNWLIKLSQASEFTKGKLLTEYTRYVWNNYKFIFKDLKFLMRLTYCFLKTFLIRSNKMKV